MKFYAVLPFVLQVVAWPIAHGIFRITGSFKVRGYENIKAIKGPVVFVANHVNDLDPVLTRAILPWFAKPLFWVARFRKDYDTNSEEPFKGWRGFLYHDWFFRSWGAHPAYKGTGDYEKSLRHHLKLLADDYSVCIFPQGLKAKHLGRKAPVHGGAAFLASHTHIPMIPIAISGTEKLGPYELFFGGRNLTVSIGAPIKVPKAETEENPEFYRKYVAQAVNDIYAMRG